MTSGWHVSLEDRHIPSHLRLSPKETKPAVALPAFVVPGALLFATDYREVYPWVTPVFVGLLAWMVVGFSGFDQRG